jgi:hypothetical protein
MPTTHAHTRFCFRSSFSSISFTFALAMCRCLRRGALLELNMLSCVCVAGPRAPCRAPSAVGLALAPLGR